MCRKVSVAFNYAQTSSTDSENNTCNYFKPTQFVQRLTVSRSGQSGLKFNVQVTILRQFFVHLIRCHFLHFEITVNGK